MTGISRSFAKWSLEDWSLVDNKAGHKQLMSVSQNSDNFKRMGLKKDFAVTF